MEGGPSSQDLAPSWGARHPRCGLLPSQCCAPSLLQGQLLAHVQYGAPGPKQRGLSHDEVQPRVRGSGPGGHSPMAAMFVLPSAQGGQGGEGSCDLNPRTPMGTRPSWGLRLDQA